VTDFSKRVNDLLKTIEQAEQSVSTSVPNSKTRASEGAQWTAGVVFNGDNGQITTRPTDKPIGDWDSELRSWGFDPAKYEVVEPIKFSTWEAQVKGGGIRQMWAYRATIKTKSGLSSTEIEALTKPVFKDKRVVKKHKGTYTLVVPLGDWQIGKSDGDGLDGTVKRIEKSFQSVLDRANYLRECGYAIGGLLVCSLGDLGEGCQGHYEQQTFNVQLDRRDQNKIVRRLARNALMMLAPHFSRVTVAAVAGNHGENRRNGKSFTSTNDNDDVAVWESVAETLSVNPDLYGHIKWLLPTTELSASVQVGKRVIGLAHGHQIRGGDAGTWWSKQTLGNRPVASADILLTGHYHHFKCVEIAKQKWHIQVPSQDGGSLWFEEIASNSSTGQVTFLLDDSGWCELQIV